MTEFFDGELLTGNDLTFEQLYSCRDPQKESFAGARCNRADESVSRRR